MTGQKSPPQPPHIFSSPGKLLLSLIPLLLLYFLLAIYLLELLPSDIPLVFKTVVLCLPATIILCLWLQIRIIGPTRDSYRQLLEVLRKSEEKFHSVVDSTDDSIYLVDSSYQYIFMNRMHLTRLGLSAATYQNRPYADFHSPEEAEKFQGLIDQVVSSGRSIQQEHKSHRDNRYFLRTMSPVKDKDGLTTAVTVISKQITERKLMEENLRSQSITDELTGLYNRRGFFALAEQQLKVAHRVKKKLLILAADLDFLKKVNDTYGHNAGDLLLIDAANLLRETFRASDIIARIGGDEFVVMQLEQTDVAAELLTDRLYKNLIRHNDRPDREHDLSISIGITYYDPEKPCSLDELLAKADELMYQHKKSR